MEKITGKDANDRRGEIQEKMLNNSRHQTRYLRRISNNVAFFFWVFFLSLVLSALIAFFVPYLILPR